MDGLGEVIKAGQLIGEPRTIPDGLAPFVVVPENCKVEHLEVLLPAPVRARAGVTAKSVETFCEYFNRFQEERSVIFADPTASVIVGIIDYHAVGVAGWCYHRVAYHAPRSMEWQTWTGKNKSPMIQADFAQFIEDNLVDIRQPAGADMLEISRSLQAKKSVDFASSIRLSDGQQEFTYNETIAGATSKGKLKVPEEFTLGIPVLLGGPAYEVRARLRYRISDGKLSLWYDLYRPEHIEKDAFDAVCAAICTATRVDVWQGTP